MLGRLSRLSRFSLLGVILFVLGLTFALAIGAGFWQARQNNDEAHKKFDAMVGNVTAQISRRMQRYESGLRAARGVVLANRDLKIERDDFLRYSSSLEIDKEFP